MPSILLKPFRDTLEGYTARLSSLSSGGKKILGYFCTYTPVEIPHAMGFIPVRILGGDPCTDQSSILTPSFICPYMRRSLDRALNGEYDFLSGLVQGYTCDVACGLINIWEQNTGGELFHTVPLPYNKNPDSRIFFRSALLELVEKLESIGGHFTESALAESLNLYCDIRALVLSLYTGLNTRKASLSGGDLLRVILTGFVIPPEEYLDMMKTLIEGLDRLSAGNMDRLPVYLSGSIVESPELYDIIEECGMKIVADDLCTGFRNFDPPDGHGDNPIERLIDRYMRRFPCPSRTRAGERAPLIKDSIQSSGARGVVFLFQKFCAPHLADHPVLLEELKKDGIHSITIEIEESGFTKGQIRTRLEGFAEMIR